MENLVEHFRDRKFPETFEPSSARDEIERFQEIYKSGGSSATICFCRRSRKSRRR